MQDRRDIFPLLSLLLVILLYPLLDHDDVQRLVLGGLMFGPLLLATFTRFSDCSGSPFIAPSTSSVLVPSSTIWVVVERIGESLFG
jgi:hypothetical protein